MKRVRIIAGCVSDGGGGSECFVTITYRQLVSCNDQQQQQRTHQTLNGLRLEFIHLPVT